MAIQVLGVDGVTVLAVDSGFNAQRVTIRPPKVNGWSSFGVVTGNLPAGLAAGAAIFSLRNGGSNFLMLRRLSFQFVTATAFTAAQRLEFALSVARSWTVADSNGTQLTASSGKHRSTLATLNMDARIAAAAALTNGTRTIDPNPISTIGGGSTGIATGIGPTPMFSHDTGDYPLLLGPQEGLVITNQVLFGAGGAVVAYVSFEIGEVLDY